MFNEVIQGEYICLLEQLEKNIISSLIYYSDELLEFFDITSLKVDYFTQPITKHIFNVLNYCFLKNKKVSLIVLQDLLTQFVSNDTEYDAAVKYLYSLKKDGQYFLIQKDYEILQNNYIKNKLNSFCNDVLNEKISENNFFNKINDWREKFLDIITIKEFNHYLESKEAIEKYQNLIKDIKNSKDGNKYLKTGYFDLDKKIKGLIGGQLFILAARPGVGKTAFAINLLANNLKYIQKITNSGVKQPAIGFFSLEMKNTCILERLIALVSKLKLSEVKKPLEGMELTSFNEKLYQNAQEKITNSNILFCDVATVSIAEIASLIKLWVHKYDLKFVIIDYLQLITSSHSKDHSNWNQNQKISAISRTLKLISIDLNVSIIALAQLNRKSEERKAEDREPLLSDLRESGSIEQDADIVSFLYHDEKNKQENDENNFLSTPINLKIGKNRHGEIGFISFIFDKTLGSFKLKTIRYDE